MQNNGNTKLSSFKITPLLSQFIRPTPEFISEIHRNSSAVLVSAQHGLFIDSRYFKSGIRGSSPNIYVRGFILKRLQEAVKLISPDYGFVIFDGYRDKKVQEGLFESFFEQIKTKNPTWSQEQLDKETRKYVAHPDEPSRFEVPPHNSGGAVDIGLTRLGKPVNMGTEFDDLTEKAGTDFFENPFDPQCGIAEHIWNEVRVHRRILFHSLVSVGFTNWKHEWWHYDIGNCVWAQEFGIPWIYDSMASLIKSES